MQAYQAPTVFRIPLEDGWFVPLTNKTFCDWTGYPQAIATIYNTDARYFAPLFPAGAISAANEAIHPFIIVRVPGMSDRECSRLRGCIKELMDARVVAQARLEVEMGLANAKAASGLTVGEVAGGITVLGDAGDTGPAGGGWGDIGTRGLDVRVIAVFDDEDSNDGDYVYQTSDGRSSEGEAGSSEGEDEAMETDHEVEKEIIDLTNEADENSVIDLTYLCDDSSSCSQEL